MPLLNVLINQKRTSVIPFLTAVLILSSMFLLTVGGDFVMYCTLETVNKRDHELSSDYWPTNGWLNASLEESGMDSTKLQDMLTHIDDANFPFEYIIVIKDGYIAFQNYFHWLYEPNKKKDVFLATRMLTAILFGMALDKGLIDNITHPVVDFFPEYNIANLTAWKQNITIEHLLTYASGLEWDEITESYGSPDNSYTQMQASDDWAGFILNRTVLYEPGTHWNYGGGDSHLLSCIFAKETGISLEEFAIENLFTPLNITNITWPQETTGISNGANGLKMTPHDFAKLGYLILNNGTWGSTQVVSQDWVHNATMERISVPEEFWLGYDTQFGYHWYIHNDPSVFFCDRLNGTRNVFVIPEHNMVVVFSTGLTNGPYIQGEILYDYILASLETPTSTTSAHTTSTTSIPTTTSSTPSTESTITGGELFIISIIVAVIAVPVILILLYIRTKGN